MDYLPKITLHHFCYFQTAEKLISHVKKCPICQEPFADVNVFMTHLSKCNVSSDEEEEEEESKPEEGEEMVIGFLNHNYFKVVWSTHGFGIGIQSGYLNSGSI